MLIPGLNYKLAIRFCQLLGLTKFLELEARRFTKLDIPLDVKDRFAAAFPHVNVDRSMIVAIKEEAKSIFDEDRRHV